MVWRGAQAAINSSSPMGDATRSFIVSPAFSRERLLSWQIGISIGHFQFTASYTDGTIVLRENVKFSANDGALLQKLLRHLETASKRILVRRPRSNNSLWQRLSNEGTCRKLCKCFASRTIRGQKAALAAMWAGAVEMNAPADG
jgi:hypothetical protein